MKESGVVLIGESTAQEWAVVAHRAGKWVPLTPKYFPVCGSYDEARERAHLRSRMDPQFRSRFAGYHIAAARVDGQIDL